VGGQEELEWEVGGSLDLEANLGGGKGPTTLPLDLGSLDGDMGNYFRLFAAWRGENRGIKGGKKIVRQWGATHQSKGGGGILCSVNRWLNMLDCRRHMSKSRSGAQQSSPQFKTTIP